MTESENARARERYRKDPEYRAKRKLQAASYYARNPEPYKNRAKEYRDRMRAEGSERSYGLSTVVMYRLMTVNLLAQRDGWICHFCKQPVLLEDASIDHMSGPKDNTAEALKLSHLRCNMTRPRTAPPEFLSEVQHG